MTSYFCQLGDGTVCSQCGKDYGRRNVVNRCPAGSGVWRIGDTAKLSSGEIVEFRSRSPEDRAAVEAICRECRLFIADRGLESPVCALMSCACSPAALANRWENHLSNANTSCLSPDKPKWGPTAG